MSFAVHFRIATDKEKVTAVARLVKASTGDFNFYLFVLFGVTIALLGLGLNSPEIVIGSTLIAPVLYPILSLSLGLILADRVLIYRSFRTLGIAFCVSIGVVFLLATVLQPLGLSFASMHTFIVAQVSAPILYFIVACVGGVAVTYALIHTEMNETLPGVAISVSLIPPLAMLGMSIAMLDGHLALQVFGLFVLNVVGTLLASVATFSLMDVRVTRYVVDSAIRQEERRLAQEEALVHDLVDVSHNNHA
ncbi:MAG: DUF389 domain-containing protein [Candidatus Pacebacteria bacterium]|nr:DUF389 domain-containing protein [Candidatus Paceibacterota bacterium]